MTRRFVPVALLTACVLLAASFARAADDYLKLVPEGAMGIAVVHNPAAAGREDTSVRPTDAGARRQVCWACSIVSAFGRASTKSGRSPLPCYRRHRKAGPRRR